MNYSYILIQKLGLIKYLTLPAELEFEIEKVDCTNLLLHGHKIVLGEIKVYLTISQVMAKFKRSKVFKPPEFKLLQFHCQSLKTHIKLYRVSCAQATVNHIP